MNASTRRAFLLAIVTLVPLLAASGFAQNTINVPTDAPTIQAAIFAAQNGDTVEVAPGLYFESINFQGKNITVMSSAGAAVTTINSNFQPAAQFFNGEANTAVLKGFTFTNGSGIQIFSASPTIQDNVITNNQGCQAGAITVFNGSPIIRGNTISNNQQFCTGVSPSAGGIAVDGQGSVQILNNTISGNQAAPGSPAGGIFTDASGTTTISGNKIQSNVTTAAGGGIYSNGVNVIITGNLITGNSAASGGGIFIVPGSNAILANNTVALNQAPQGSQLQLDGMAGFVNLWNNVFYDLTGNGAIFCSVTGFTSFPPAQNNDAVSFVGGPTGTPVPAYTGSCSDQTGLNGNLQTPPQLLDPVNGDFHLSPTSPLVDAGNNNAPNLPTQDLDGNPRIAAGSNLCIGAVDIGAYEVVFGNLGSASILGSTNINFGQAFVGIPNSFSQPVTLTGTGGCAQITSITTSSDFQQTSNCSVLRAGDSCTVQVTFAPKVPGERLGTLKVNLLAPPATLTAELSGNALNAATVNPTDLKFGIQGIQTSQFQSVSIIALNGQPLVPSSITITGDFQQFNNCSQFPSNGCFISVQFTPTMAGPRTGLLTVVSNLGTFVVPLSGDGAAPQSSLSPASLSFPSQAIGTPSTPQSITLTNNGTADLIWNSVVSTPDFQVTPNNCSLALSPGTSCSFNVVFNPTTIGPISGRVEIDTNGGSATASLTGTGTAPIASLTPQFLNFDTQPLNSSSAPQTITVTNISSASLQIPSLSAPDNFLATSSCPAVLAVNATCTINVVFDPVSAGPYGGLLTLGTSQGPVTAALSVGSNHIFHVPSEVFSISQAVQLAKDGDTILVAPGTYFDQINFQGKAITIASTSGPEVTTLDGSGFSTPVFAFSNEGPGSVLQGFTITHAQNSAIFVFGASPTIQNNIITENSGCSGAGIQLQSSSSIIRGNTISNNTINNCSGDGAGVWIGSGGNVQLIKNTITGNQIAFSGSGAGVAVSGANATITSNIIQNNADFSFANGGGGVALINGGSASLIQNLITGNSAVTSGGGVWAALGTFPSSHLINNTIADNVAPDGSGLFVTTVDFNAVFVNNLITDSAGSSAVSCGQLLGGIFTANDVFNFAGGRPYGNCQDMTSSALNISQDPQFVNSAAGNYRLQSSSPAIDQGIVFTGQTGSSLLPDHDLDGNGRVLPANPATCYAVPDMGAYEFSFGLAGTPGPLPASWDFGSAQLGLTGPTFTFNLSAQGCVPIASIKTTGDFQQTNFCNSAISNASSCSIFVTFTPQHLGLRSGTLTVDYGASIPPATIALTGEGVQNLPVASPATLTFPTQAVGTSSSAQQVFIFPVTSGQLFVNAIWITGDFSQSNSCSAMFPITGAGCIINVVFSPTGPASGQGSLYVSTNQGVSVVPLTGTVSSVAVATFNPASLVFSGQQVGTSSPAQAVTLTNSGSSALSFGLGLGPDFSETSNCPQPLPAGNSCTISVVFSPSTPGNRTGSLTLTGNSNPPAAPVALSGTGVGPLPSFSPTSLTFASRLVGTSSPAQSISLSNNGNAPLAITGMAVSTDFSETDNCGTSLAAGATCTLNVIYTPTADGRRNGSLTLVSNFNGLPTVTLTGTGQAIQGSVSPGSLVFPTIFLGSSSAAQSVTYTNTGSLPVSITGISITGDFTQTNTCGTTLAVGATCTASVTFTPTARGARTGSLSISGNFNVAVPSVSLSGTGQAIQGTPTPTSLSFADQQVGTTSVRQAIILNNTGDAPLVVSGVTASGDFSAFNGCGAPLPVGSNCQVSVTFSPTVLGARTGSVIINSNASTPIPPITVAGNGIGPFPVFSVSSLTFGPQFVGTASAPQSVTLSNTGTMTFTSIVFSLGGDYTQTNNCGTSLAAGASCTINLTFRPSASGTRQANMVVTGNLFGSPGPSLNLSGTGETMQVTASPASLAFAAAVLNSTSAPQAVTFTNAGDLAVAITGVTISGDFAQTNNCATSLAPGASCTVNITFTPTARGTRSGSLSFTSTSPGTPPVVALSGIGQALTGSLAPASFDFGAEPVNTTSNPQIFTYANTGDLPLNISSVAVAPDFSQTNTCPATLAAGASCTINVTFVPRAVGVQTASLTVSGSATSTASVAGNGVMPQASLAPASLSFGHQKVGTSSAPQLVTVTNSGAYAFFINQVSFPGGYLVTNNCPSLVNPGTSCTISVVFAPTPSTTGTGSLTIGGDFAATPASVSLSGTADVSSGTLSPASLAFPSQVVSTTSSSQTVTLSSTGNVPINLTAIQTSGDFSQTNNCGSAVAAGTSCTINITFTPTAHGARNGTLTVTGDFTGAAPSAALSGSGVTPTASWTPANLIFANQLVGTASGAQSVTLTNSGDGPLSISGIIATGDFAQSNTCGGTLAAGASCSVNVTFTPAATGSRSGSLSLNSNSSAAVAPITLAGTGVAPAAALSPSSLNFASQLVNTSSAAQAVTLSNPGTATLTITGISVTGDFSQANTCGTSLAAGASCSINVTFAPLARGSRSGTLTVNSSAAGPAPVVSLTGTGIAPVASLTGSLAFAPQVVGTTSTRSATLTNNGDATLNIASIVISGAFSQTNTCGASLAAGSSCTIQVSFTPTTAGPASSSLVVTDSDPASGSQTLAASGTGVDYSITASPASVSVKAGSSAAYTTTVSALGGTFSNAVSLSCSGLPTGAACSFSPASVTPGAGSAASSLTITTGNGQHGTRKTPTGTYTITVSGASGNRNHSTTATLVVQ
ncbi:MAG TPA: choice-of-anchor D domain-containing protein [Candidatus Angelobacter sp.]|nr:choice-of-anchor D domain-containing protein [Candidatus Angelobacter sp.]